MSWSQRPFVALDTETTGTNVHRDRIVQAAVLTIDPGDGSIVPTYHSTINPGVEIPAAATELHGISTDYVRENGHNSAEALPAVAAALAAAWRRELPVVAFNAPFDLTLLGAELARYGHGDLTVGAVIDPRAIDCGCDPDRPGRRRLQQEVAPHYGVTLAEHEAHGAYADALAAARVAWVQAHRYPELVGRATLTQLQQRQRRWHAERAIQHSRRVTSQGKAHARSREWPVQSRLLAVA